MFNFWKKFCLVFCAVCARKSKQVDESISSAEIVMARDRKLNRAGFIPEFLGRIPFSIPGFRTNVRRRWSGERRVRLQE